METPSDTPATKRHPGVLHLLQFFEFKHLPPHLQAVSMPFYKLATECADMLPDNAEKVTCLRKLLEAKDCAVRALIAKG